MGQLAQMAQRGDLRLPPRQMERAVHLADAPPAAGVGTVGCAPATAVGVASATASSPSETVGAELGAYRCSDCEILLRRYPLVRRPPSDHAAPVRQSAAHWPSCIACMPAANPATHSAPARPRLPCRTAGVGGGAPDCQWGWTAGEQGGPPRELQRSRLGSQQHNKHGRWQRPRPPQPPARKEGLGCGRLAAVERHGQGEWLLLLLLLLLLPLPLPGAAWG